MDKDELTHHIEFVSSVMDERDGHLPRARLFVFWYYTFAGGRPYTNGVDTVHVAIGSTGIVMTASISSSKDIYCSLSISSLEIHTCPHFRVNTSCYVMASQYLCSCFL